MKALVWHGNEDIRCDTVSDPQIEDPRDAIVKVTSCAICGSDLHLFHNFIPAMLPGDIMGHEMMGEVVEVGSGVNGKLKKGDWIVVPLPAAPQLAAAARPHTPPANWSGSRPANRDACSSAAAIDPRTSAPVPDITSANRLPRPNLRRIMNCASLSRADCFSTTSRKPCASAARIALRSVCQTNCRARRVRGGWGRGECPGCW